jgi:arylformamidase
VAQLRIVAELGNMRYTADLRQPRDISIPVRFAGAQLSVFGAPLACSRPYETKNFMGDVGQGGSCNCEIYSFIPHTSGTHTECVGHIADAHFTIHDILQESLIPVTLITVAPRPARDCNETYVPKLRADDTLITHAALQKSLDGHYPAFLEGVVIRTIPNTPEKTTRNYDVAKPAFFSVEGIRYLTGLGIKHLLADIPSIDRLDDEGKLTNHHIFWGVSEGSHTVDAENPSPKTITELIYVPETIADGPYLLNLQVAPFMTDAAPSRPILYEVRAT